MKKTKLHDELFETAEPVRITWKQLEQKWRHRWQISEWATPADRLKHVEADAPYYSKNVPRQAPAE